MSNHDSESEDSMQQFGNQSELGKQVGNVRLQGRTKPPRIRMCQLVCPLVVISLGMRWRQHMPSLVNLVDQLHQDNRIWHFPSSIVQDGVNIPLIVADERDVQPARGCWLLFHQQERQEQRAVELKCRNALLGVTLGTGISTPGP